MKTKKIDYSEIPRLTPQDFKRGRRLMAEERVRLGEAYRNTFRKEPPHFGRPLKYTGAKLQSISIRLHPNVLRWARKEAHKQHKGYQSFLSEFLLRHVA